MMHTTKGVAVAAAALLLAGCGSTGGTATPASVTSSSATLSSLSAPSTSAAISSLSTGSSSASSSATSSSAASTVANSAGVASAPAGSNPSGSLVASTVSSSAVSSSAVSSNTVASGDRKSTSTVRDTTAGKTTGGLDATSAAWITTFCNGFTPILELTKTGSSAGSGSTDPAAGQKKLVGYYQKFGAAFTDTAAKLRPLPPPTFPGGSGFAGKIIAAFSAVGPALTKDAKQLAAVNATKDPSALATAAAGLSTKLQSAVQPLQELGSLKLAAQTQDAIAALPACVKLQSLTDG